MTRPRRSALRQSASHRQLLGRTAPTVVSPEAASLSAIIVPAARPAANLDHAITLARRVRCRLVVICSKDARAADALRLLDDRSFTEATVVELPNGYDPFGFDTTNWVKEALPRACARRDSDLSIKRNIGLALAHMRGWERIFFMDDDIRDVDSYMLWRTVAMLDKQPDGTKYNAVGMRVPQYPDNSVACHAHRLTGGDQDVFISGSVLAVDCTEPFGFFPDIYNEDWLFFYRDAAYGQLGSSGKNATQLRYDPFAHPERAAGQEFGDVLAEGLYALLEHGTKADGADRVDWRGFLDTRRSFLAAILSRRDRAPELVREGMVAAMNAALDSLDHIEPEMCMDYIGLWRGDLKRWADFLPGFPPADSDEAALRHLGLAPPEPDNPALIDDVSMPAEGNPGPAALPFQVLADPASPLSVMAPAVNAPLSLSGAAR